MRVRACVSECVSVRAGVRMPGCPCAYGACMRACVRACMHACMRVCVCVSVSVPQEPVGRQADVWSLGCCVLDMGALLTPLGRR